MDLPRDSIGITDLLAYRDCPRRFSYGMRRHIGIGKQSDEMTPEKGGYAEDYGSAIHLAIEALEDGQELDAALQVAWNLYGHRLEPGDIGELRDDLETYLTRDDTNVRTVTVEQEFRVPLFRYKGRQIYFRFKVDRLYERIDEPGAFIMRDYKSSRHPKTEAEVRDDLQMWAYNWALHEHFPEMESLEQIYDQLKFGERRTRKTAEARAQMKEWLIVQATAVIEDENFRDDGLLRARHNQWCAWCPILESCPVVPELTEWARVRVAQLAPTVRQGRRQVMALEPGSAAKYAEHFKEAKEAQRILERFTNAMRDLLRDMPAEKRLALGYELKGRKDRSFTPEAMEAMHDLLGRRFYELVKVTKTSLESGLADAPDLLATAMDMAVESVGSEVIAEAKL